METSSFQGFCNEWLADIKMGNPSTIELGRKFAWKLISQYYDLDEASAEVIYCDGTGDGGIDVAFLEKGDHSDDVGTTQGDTWYLVQSKYGSAFHGVETILKEGQKVIETLDGRRDRLSSLAEGLVERLTNFRHKASERDRILLVFGVIDPLDEDEKRAQSDLRAMGRARLGALFDVETVSVRMIFERITEEEEREHRIKVVLKANVVHSDDDLLVGSTSLMDLYSFLKVYRDQTGDLDRVYEMNVRRFLGARGKVNHAIHDTLKQTPERFGLYNNGITIVVSNLNKKEDSIELTDPYIVNGCQTTRTIWDVFHGKLEAGGTGADPDLDLWKERAAKGVIVTKIVKVGDRGKELLQAITRYTNTQNAIREKDFLALTEDFRSWSLQMEHKYGVFLEIQRGGWDSRKAWQKQHPEGTQFKESANAFDLLKVYGSGCLGEAGLAFGKNAPFLPNGAIFKRIMGGDSGAEEPFDVGDLYAAYRLKTAADDYKFGRGADNPSRRQTRFLFYMVTVDLLKDVIIRTRSNVTPFSNKEVTRALLKLFDSDDSGAARTSLLDAAVDLIDSYLTQGTEECIFDEPAYTGVFNNDLNGFLKWEKLGKSEADSPRLRTLLAVTKQSMGRRTGGQPSPRELITNVLNNFS